MSYFLFEEQIDYSKNGTQEVLQPNTTKENIPVFGLLKNRKIKYFFTPLKH